MVLKINKNIKFFNMIEVALAMAIIAFGMTSILGLFPVGLNACRNAVAENYSADAVEQFSSYLKGYAEASRTNFDQLFGFYADTKPVATAVACTDATNDFLKGVSLGVDHSGTAYTPTPIVTGWTIFPAKSAALKNVYFVAAGPGNYMNPAGVIFPTTDFTGMILVWKSQLTYYRPNGNGAAPPNGWMSVTDDAYATGAVLNIEVSWPLEVPYDTRQKRTFYIEVTRPQQ
ncbi:MAG: hypothetical protein WC808_06965 [Patescibacteria group bacterium]|jgi:hypothetical protein